MILGCKWNDLLLFLWQLARLFCHKIYFKYGSKRKYASFPFVVYWHCNNMVCVLASSLKPSSLVNRFIFKVPRSWKGKQLFFDFMYKFSWSHNCFFHFKLFSRCGKFVYFCLIFNTYSNFIVFCWIQFVV